MIILTLAFSWLAGFAVGTAFTHPTALAAAFAFATLAVLTAGLSTTVEES